MPSDGDDGNVCCICHSVDELAALNSPHSTQFKTLPVRAPPIPTKSYCALILFCRHNTLCAKCFTFSSTSLWCVDWIRFILTPQVDLYYVRNLKSKAVNSDINSAFQSNTKHQVSLSIILNLSRFYQFIHSFLLFSHTNHASSHPSRPTGQRMVSSWFSIAQMKLNKHSVISFDWMLSFHNSFWALTAQFVPNPTRSNLIFYLNAIPVRVAPIHCRAESPNQMTMLLIDIFTTQNGENRTQIARFISFCDDGFYFRFDFNGDNTNQDVHLPRWDYENTCSFNCQSTVSGMESFNSFHFYIDMEWSDFVVQNSSVVGLVVICTHEFACE